MLIDFMDYSIRRNIIVYYGYDCRKILSVGKYFMVNMLSGADGDAWVLDSTR